MPPAAAHIRLSSYLHRVSTEFESLYLNSVAKSRWGVLLVALCFDIACLLFRGVVAFAAMGPGEVNRALDNSPTLIFNLPTAEASGILIAKERAQQLVGMVVLYSFLWVLNKRSSRIGDSAARQEELLLSACMAAAVCHLLSGLTAATSSDYVYACFFLICTTTFLKIRWWVGTTAMASPVALAQAWRLWRGAAAALPHEGHVHIVVAWAVGGLMSYLSEGYRRQMFESQQMAASAHAKELLEAKARIKAQRQLAAAQAQAAHRALSVTREKVSGDTTQRHAHRFAVNSCELLIPW